LGQGQGSIPSETLKRGLLQVSQSKDVAERTIVRACTPWFILKGAASSFLRRDHPAPVGGSRTITEGILGLDLSYCLKESKLLVLIRSFKERVKNV
jgi:hypothetical protein